MLQHGLGTIQGKICWVVPHIRPQSRLLGQQPNMWDCHKIAIRKDEGESSDILIQDQKALKEVGAP